MEIDVSARQKLHDIVGADPEPVNRFNFFSSLTLATFPVIINI